MKITKTFWKTEIEIAPEEIKEFMFHIPGENLQGKFYAMIESIFKHVNNYFK
jgi:hypothetical protein